MLFTSNRFKTIWLLLFLAIGSITSTFFLLKKRVCIIGAGASGLTAVKYFSAQPDVFQTIAFDKNSDVGGLWIYTDSQDFDQHGLPVHSSMYKYLRTNSPKEFMAFPDYQEFGGENRSYTKHEYVLQYLQNYTDHFNLRPYIRFDTLVEKVTPLNFSKWLVQTLNLNTHRKVRTICSAVIVANGNFFRPNIPKILGIEKFPGRVIHSHIYRRPEEFANQTVVILGAGYSGMDIGMDLSPYAKTIYLSHRHKRITAELPKNMIQRLGVVKADEKGLILSDNSTITADAMIYCTGFLHEFPFLDEKSGITVEKGKYIHPLYKHLVNVNYPTMFFINIPQPSFMFWIANGQVQWVRAVLDGKIKLPTLEKMSQQALLRKGVPLSKAHYLLEETGPYYDQLANEAGFEPAPPHFAEDIWQAVIDQETIPMRYKEKNARKRPDGRWELYWP